MRRPTTTPFGSPADVAALSAVLDGTATTPTRPVAPPTQPPGYRVAVNGSIATLTTPTGLSVAFDGRTWTRGPKHAGAYAKTPEAVAAPAAERAAWDEARRLAAGPGVIRCPVPVVTMSNDAAPLGGDEEAI